MPDLSPDAKKGLLALQKQLRMFLKQFKKLEKGSAEYKKHAPQSKNIQALYLQLSLMDLKTSEPVKPVVEKAEEKENKSKKEARKARREKRKKERKGARSERRKKRKELKVARQKQKDDKSGAKEESKFRFDELNKLWDILNIEKITTNFREYLNEAEALLDKAKNFIDYAETYAPNQFLDEIEKATDFIAKIEKFIAVARNISGQVDRYAKLAQQVVATTLSIPSKIEDLKDDIVAEANKIFAAAKSFIATADTSDEEIKLNVENLQKYLKRGQEKLSALEQFVGIALKDENGDKLPDWYNKLEEKYNELLGGTTDLIPGTKIDDKILLQITSLKGSIDRFVKAAKNKADEFDLQGKIKTIEGWLGKLSEFTTAITGFVDNIKEGDLAGIYQDLKDFKSLIDSDTDILEGTDIDDKIKAKLKEYSGKAQSWLMNVVTGGDPSKEGEVKEILGLIDKLILSSGGVVDHSSKYEKDEDKITVPEIKDVSQKQIDEVLEKYGITKKGASYEGILSDMKDAADVVKAKVDGKYKDVVKRGALASLAFKDAKEEYDDAVKKHNDYFKASNEIGKKILNGLFSVAGIAINAFAPGAGSAVTAVGNALLGDFKGVNDEIDKIIPDNLSFLGDLAKDIIPSVLPIVGEDIGLIEIDGKKVIAGLNELYVNGVTARYQEVLGLLNSVKGKASVVGKNLRTVENSSEIGDEELKEVHKKVIILELKWSGLVKDVNKKYINLPYPPINQKKAYRNASRYLYSVWLIKFPQKEIRIGNSMIDQFKKFGVMKEAKAQWDTGFWATAGRGFFGFFGGDPFDYRPELKKMKAWASKENDKLKSAKAWANVF